MKTEHDGDGTRWRRNTTKTEHDVKPNTMKMELVDSARHGHFTQQLAPAKQPITEKRSYLLPHENFIIPLPNQDSSICFQLKPSQVHCTHQKPCHFMHGKIILNLSPICPAWSGRGHVGKRVTAVTFISCPTVSLTHMDKRHNLKFSLIYFQQSLIAYDHAWSAMHTYPQHCGQIFSDEVTRS